MGEFGESLFVARLTLDDCLRLGCFVASFKAWRSYFNWRFASSLELCIPIQQRHRFVSVGRAPIILDRMHCTWGGRPRLANGLATEHCECSSHLGG